jgi:ABC-2 type transport system ATP-binding protein
MYSIDIIFIRSVSLATSLSNHNSLGGVMSNVVIRTKNLQKSFTVKKQAIKAVNGVDLEVNAGEIFGFLGPNGAGKTTTLRMLATLLPIDDGEAIVAGYDVRTKSAEVRKRVGYVSQLGGADEEATGLEDMVLRGRLYGMTLDQAKDRALELSKALQLEEFVKRKVKTYSGGQKRRLNVATGIMHKPVVLFLDEPTTGLDPQNRANLWEQIRKLREQGTTIFLTTHYLEEADALSNHLAIMDDGKIVAQGTPRELKAKIAGDAVVIKPSHDGHSIDKVSAFLADQPFVKEARIEGDTVRLYVENGSQALPKIITLLETKKVVVENVSLSQPSLDDVFLMQTGRSLRDTGLTEGAK